jgi:hypothetical protein
MKMRELLREVAVDYDEACGGECVNCKYQRRAIALRALANRMDALERDVADRRRALDKAVALGRLNPDHGEGEAQRRIAGELSSALNRLDEALSNKT